MANGLFTLAWRLASEKDDYWHGVTQTRFSAQIGKSTNTGLYMWMIFHDDFRFAIHGEEVPSVREARFQAQAWLEANAKPNPSVQAAGTAFYEAADVKPQG
jgi:hypothetical protein